MTNTERLKKLRTFTKGQIEIDPNPVDTLESLNGETTDYLLFWENREQRAMICAKTGEITAYLHHGEEYVDDDLQQEVTEEIDARIEEIENL